MLRYAFALILFAAAGAGAWTLAPRLAALAEARYAAQVDAALQAGGYRWATGDVDGLTVTLSGPAPSNAAADEATAIVAAISPVLTVTSQITEAQAVPPTIIPPQLDILKGADSLILTGAIADQAMAQALRGDATMLTYGAAPFPADWAATAPILLEIANALQHARLSLEEATITVTGLATSETARKALQPRLAALKALGWRVDAAIDAPPPVLADFRLTAALTPSEGAKVSCAAAKQADAEAIAAAARSHLGSETNCRIGAGAPDDAWAEAAIHLLSALSTMPGAQAEMAGKIINLTALPPTTRDGAAAAQRDLISSLPSGYRLVLDDTALEKAGEPPLPPFNLAIDWPGGGAPLTIAATQAEVGFDAAASTLSAYARAQFPGVKAEISRTNGTAPPPDWRSAARIALEALSHLDRGAVDITEGQLSLTGAASTLPALRAAHETLTKADESWRPTSRIAYDPGRIAAVQPVPPRRCAAEVTNVIAEAPLSFQPASTTLTTQAKTTINRIAAILTRCDDAMFEIGGHTDAQGSEAGNLALSRNRAEAVLTALTSAKAPPGRLLAKGYGEARPIASNDTAVGRALNRRIEFTLIEDPE